MDRLDTRITCLPPSRSPAIVIGYLMRTYNVSLEQCLIHVVKARPCVLPNDGFLKQLIIFDRFLVDRRRQRDEAARVKLLSATPTREIPIQHHTPVPSQQGQPTAPIVVLAPQCPPVEGPMQTIASSVVRPSASAESIHVVPIQIPSKPTHSNQVTPSIPIRPFSSLVSSDRTDSYEDAFCHTEQARPPVAGATGHSNATEDAYEIPRRSDLVQSHSSIEEAVQCDDHQYCQTITLTKNSSTVGVLRSHPYPSSAILRSGLARSQSSSRLRSRL